MMSIITLNFSAAFVWPTVIYSALRNSLTANISWQFALFNNEAFFPISHFTRVVSCLWNSDGIGNIRHFSDLVTFYLNCCWMETQLSNLVICLITVKAGRARRSKHEDSQDSLQHSSHALQCFCSLLREDARHGSARVYFNLVWMPDTAVVNREARWA